MGHGSIKSVSRMNSTVVDFVDSHDKADPHVVSFRGQVLTTRKSFIWLFHSVLKSLALYFTTNSLKRFVCVEGGLVIRLCPNIAGGSLDSRSARDAALRAVSPHPLNL